VPGGLGAGTLYQQGALQVGSTATLQTRMFVYPNGIAAGDGPVYDNWTFTAATNRTEKGLEIVGIYWGSGPDTGALGVFDWSCSMTDPCSNGATEPAWIWTRKLTDLACYHRMMSDGGGHRHNMLYYSNASAITDPAVSPPGWTNSAHLWNYCARSWDLVYRHTFFADQKDCSLDGSCGWWGPILETFIPDPQPSFKEVGFMDSVLITSSGQSSLDASVTWWVDPKLPLRVVHRAPNRSWGVGSVTRN
jgi:hypothetical protein